jgi:trimeric autotransporter adhesin
MWKHRRKLVLIFSLLGFLGGDPTGAFESKDPGDPLRQKEFSKPELSISSSNESLEEVLPSLPNRQAWESLLGSLEAEARVHAFIDPRSGTATNLVGAFPLIPGRGVGNKVRLEDLRTSRPVHTLDATTVADAVLAFVHTHQAALGIDATQLGASRAVPVSPDLWQVSIPQTYRGVPVRHGRLAATLNNGNLVLVGTETWGNVRGLSTVAKIDAEEALKAGFEYVGGLTADDELLSRAKLEILPVAPLGQRGEGFGGPVGAGYRHRLVWTFVFRRPPGRGRWEVIVDAHDGEVLALQDVNRYANSTITGGVYPLTSTGICTTPQTCGTLQSGWPMPFADTGLAAPNDFTNSAGIYNFLGGTATTTLAGKYVEITDTCGALGNNSTTGSIALGGTGGDHDCASGGGSAGNTASSRAAFYEINKLAEMARGWLPGNTWLQSQLQANVNVNDTCNAFWDGTSIYFYLAGGGCRNTGEIAAVLDHEWGHGLDDNDAGGDLSNSSEAYADVAAIYRQQASCIGHGFFWTNNMGCGQTADGTGFNTNEAQMGAAHCDVACSGVRDADWDKHSDHTPDTPLGFVCNSCASGPGPCGRQEHCAAAPSRQAAWDLVARDLQQAPFNLDSQTAFIVGNKLFYEGSGNIGAWHACTCGISSSGCGATNAYMQWLAADDDNGNLADGTPHMTALFNAFNRHGIACNRPTPRNGGCAGGPTGQPALTATPGPYSAVLSWSSVPGASTYWVFRTEGHAGCDLGKTRIAETTGLSLTDLQVAPGRSYSYSVVAAGSSAACYGRASSCVTVSPQGSGNSCHSLTLTHTGAGAPLIAAPDRSNGCAAGTYHPGDLIQLTASPAPGLAVGNWSGTTADASNANVNSVSMPAASHTATVHYVQPLIVASFDFESDPGLSTTALWHRTAACAAATSGHSQPMALYYGIDVQCDYDNGFTNSGAATLPPISLAGVEPPIQLSFQYFLETELFDPLDAAAVGISVDGSPYEVVARNHPLGGAVTLADPSEGWKQAVIDLSPHAGSTVELRFGFDTVDDAFNSFPGFYVDDVLVRSVPVCAPSLNLSNQTVTTTRVFNVCGPITAGNNFIIGSSGDVTFHTVDRVALSGVFSVLAGGTFEVNVTCSPSLNLSNQTVTTPRVFETCGTITAGNNFIVGSGGDVTFHARDRVALSGGFSVLVGGTLRARVP